MLKKLVQQLREKNIGMDYSPVSLPIEKTKEHFKNEFLNKLSKQVLSLYEKHSDISKFTKLVLSDPENNSHNDLIAKLFEKDVQDYGDEETIYSLVDNDRFRKDLGL